MSIDPRIETGLRWATMRQVVTGVVGTVGALAYTRFLQPEDLGMFGLAFLVYNGLFLLVEAPIRDAVVYYQNQEETHSSAAFWLLAVFAILAVTLVMIFADAWAQFYQSPLAAPLTRAMAVAFLFQAAAVVPAGLLLKRFQFAIHEGLQTLYELVLFAGWVTLSLAGFGPWALVLPIIAGAIFWSATTWVASQFRPMLHPGRAGYRDILRFSKSLFGSKLILYLNANLDNAAVGTLGGTALGWYNLGESQAAYGGVVVGATVAQIALPAMAAVQDRLAQLKQIYLEMLRLAATLSTPMQIGALVLADLMLAFFLGEQWLGAVPVLRAYLVLWLVRTLLQICDAVTSATGRPVVRFAVDLAQLPFFVAGIWVGLTVWGGIAGVAWALAVVRSVAGLVYFALTMRITHTSPRDVFRFLMPSSFAGIVMGLIVYAARDSGIIQRWTAAISPSIIAEGLNLAALILTGVASYFAVLFAVDRPGFRAVVVLVWQILLPAAWRARLLAMARRLPNGIHRKTLSANPRE
ncbi:MAG: oligosaccharide flippase family protein [Chloroflexi bacterium]|nr:oligosaccharide flippase family protein [Chloroflexota bacterium]